MSLPTRQEICPFNDLDGRLACEHFLGKSVEEAEAMLREHSVYYQDDLMWMGGVAFRYYLPAVSRFIQSDAAENDVDFIAHFASTLEFRLAREPHELQPIAEQLVGVCDYVAEHWLRFGSGADAYGNPLARYKALREAFENLRKGE